MCPMAQSVPKHRAAPSGSVWWFQDRANTIAYIPPPGDRLVRAPLRGPAYLFYLFPAPVLPNVVVSL